MFDHDALYKVLDSYFGGRLIRDDDADEAEGESGQSRADIPDNLLEDLLDELDEVLEELKDEREWPQKAPTAIAIGFIDGVLAYSNGTFSNYEDAYVADMKNDAYAALDAMVDECAADFEGNRDWGEAAKGYLRQAIESGGATPADVDEELCRAQVQGFIYGADAAEDYEWKVVQSSDGGVVVTDEESLEEFTMRQLASSKSGGGLLGKMFDALGIDLSELEQAITKVAGAKDEDDGVPADSAEPAGDVSAKD